jgi:hypothetical protein
VLKPPSLDQQKKDWTRHVLFWRKKYISSALARMKRRRREIKKKKKKT